MEKNILKKRDLIIILFIIFSFLCSNLSINLLASSPSDLEDEADKLYNDAVKLVKSAKEIEPTSYQEAYKCIRQALEIMDEIITKYPESQVAFKISLGDLKLENYTTEQLKKLLPKLQTAASLEEQVIKYPERAAVPILDQAYKTINRKVMVTYDFEKATKEIVRLYAELGQFNKALKIANNISVIYYDGRSEMKSNMLTKIKIEQARTYIIDGQLEKALDIAKEDKGVRILDKRLRNIHSDSCDRIYTAIAATIADIGDLEKSLYITEKIQNNYHKARSLICIARAYEKIGNFNKAHELLDKAILITKDDIHIESSEKKYIISASEALYLKMGRDINDLEYINIALELTKSWNLSPLRLEEIIKTYSEIGQYDIALKLTQEISKTYPKINLLILIAKEINKVEQSQKADNILGQALQLVQQRKKTHYLYKNCSALIDIAEGYFNSKMNTKAEQVLLQAFKLIQGISLAGKAELLVKAAEVYYKAGLTKKADYILFQPLQENQDISIKDLISISDCYSKLENSQKYKQAFIPILEKELQKSQKTRNLVDITEIYINIDKIDKATQILDNIVKNRYKLDNYKLKNKIANNYAQIGKIDKALNVIRNIPYSYRDEKYFPKYKALNDIAALCIKSCYHEKTEEVLEQTLKAAQRIKSNQHFSTSQITIPRLNALMSCTRLWIKFSPKCENKLAVKFLHFLVGDIIYQAKSNALPKVRF